MSDPSAPKKVAKRRINDIALGRFERWALPKMAAKMPPWITPDVLTTIALVGALASSVAYALAGPDALGWVHLASFGLVVHWWGDSLDGTLARVRQIRRERYGFFVDHQADAVAALFLTLGLGLGGLMRLEIGLLLCIGVLLLMLLVNMVTIARDVFKISFAGFGPTELRLAAIVFNTVVWALGPRTYTVAGQDWTPFDLVGIVGVVALFGAWAVTAIKETILIGKLDPTPLPGQDGQAFDPTGQRVGSDTVQADPVDA